jgi:lactoylglutathione lyase
MRTLHLGLLVADLQRSLAFYTGFGFEVLGRVPGTELGALTMLKLPGDEFVSLELVDDSSEDRVERRNLSHFVVQVEDLHATVAQLAVRGIEAAEPGSPDDSEGFWTSWVDDPDGHRVELVQWPSGHPDGMTAADLAGTEESR